MPVQARVVPLMQRGGDLIVQAQHRQRQDRRLRHPDRRRPSTPTRAEPQALVMAPTRELANQVANEIEAIGAPHGRPLPADLRRRRLRRAARGARREGAHVIVGTPGRILDHLGAGRLSLAPGAASLVLDEADELLSLGFWPDMKEIGKLPAGATASRACSRRRSRRRCSSLSRVFLREPEFVSLVEGHELAERDRALLLRDDGAGEGDEPARASSSTRSPRARSSSATPRTTCAT